MKAMILAAGLGTRLGKLTEKTPKCLMKAGSLTMLEHVVERLRKAGVDQIVINLHYLAEQIQDFVRQHSSFGLEVRFSYEPEILGTGGGLRKVRQCFSGSEPFLVCNSDIYTDADFADMVAAHRSSGAIATLAVTDRKEGSYLLFGEDNRLIGWQKGDGARELIVANPAVANPLAFCGLQVISPAIFEYMEGARGAFSIISTYIEAARAGKSVKPFRIDNSFWLDMGTPENLLALRRYLEA